MEVDPQCVLSNFVNQTDEGMYNRRWVRSKIREALIGGRSRVRRVAFRSTNPSLMGYLG